MKNNIFCKYGILGFIGGSLYYIIETIYKGITSGNSSHWTMAILGAICFIIIGSLNELYSWATPLWKQCAISAIVVTILEFVTGCIVNLWLGWNIWHYEHFDVLGQICLPFSLLWFFLSGIAIVLDDYLRYWIFGEEKPKYKIL